MTPPPPPPPPSITAVETRVVTAKPASPEKRLMTFDEIQSQTKDNKKILIVHKNQVYDLTEWQHRHPGGSLVLTNINGTDATDAMAVLHPLNSFEKYLPTLHVGTVHPSEKNKIVQFSLSPLSIAFRDFRNQLEQEGLFKTRLSFYYFQAVKLLLIFTLAIYTLLRQPDSWASIAGSATLMAFFWQQLAFVAHDAGHSGITHKLSVDHAIGVFLANLLSGVSLGWWKLSHFVHHVVPNDPSKDPDIQHLPFLAISTRFFDSVYSTYYRRILELTAASKIMLRVQHYLYYVILLFGRLNLYVNSFSYLLTQEEVRSPFSEWLFLGLFWFWFSTFLSIMPQWNMIVFYFALSHALTFILHIQITLSHYAMEVVPAFENEEAFVRHQLRTTMDIECPLWLDWFHGGLQFQAIHHLFPRLPRHNLRTVQGRVVQFCKTHDIPYRTVTFVEGNWVVIGKLRHVASELIKWIKLNPST